MKTIKEKILDILSKKSLSFSNSQNWNFMLEKLPQESCKDILEFIEENPKGVEILTKNLNEKMEALENKDIQKWTKILNNEKQLFHLDNSTNLQENE